MSLPTTKCYDLEIKKPMYAYLSVGLIIFMISSIFNLIGLGLTIGVIVAFGGYFFQDYINFNIIKNYYRYVKLPRILSGNKKE